MNTSGKKRKKSAIVRVACVQFAAKRMNGFDDFAARASRFVTQASRRGCDFVVFPEYFSVPLLAGMGIHGERNAIRCAAKMAPQFIALMRGLARKSKIHIIAGSHPVLEGPRLHNVSFFFNPKGVCTQQFKLHPTPHERREWKLAGGHKLRVISTPKAKIGILVCYDVEFPEAVHHLAASGAEILFVPYCTENRAGHLRVSYCAQARAVENQIYVATAGLVRNISGVAVMDKHYAQSAAYTPSDMGFPRNAVLARAKANSEMLLIADLDMDVLRKSRHSGSVTPWLDRRRDLFKLRSKA